MATTQNGWPALEKDSPKLHKWVVPGTDRHFVLRSGSAGFLLCHLILWYHEKLHRLNEAGSPWDEWAYAWRNIRLNATDLSNHASGTAVDLNATKYPMGVTRMKAWRIARIHLRLRLYFGCIRWGGDYKYRKDQMHFEINKPLSACEKRARKLMKTPRGRRILEANPGQEKIILS